MSITAMKQALEHLDLIFAKSQALTRARDVLHEAIQQAEQTQPVAWITAGQHTSPLRTHWEGCETVHPECKAEQQEPVAWKDKTYGNLHHQNYGNSIPLYTVPPPRKPLTDEEISKLWDKHTCPLFGRKGINPTEFARAIEVAHGIKEKNT